MNETPSVPHNFIRQIVLDDRAAGKHDGRVVTRFPPEPNGYLHLGHGKAICLDFGVAREFSGICNLRMDDTNPGKEEIEYVDAIQEDVRWLGFQWHELRHASDYFEVFYRGAEKMVRNGDAYVCDLSAEEMRSWRGTLTEPGRNSPWRERSPEENLDLFRRMRAGDFADGEKTLRARIDMSAGNINMRDPAIYRIRRMTHQNTGDDWLIYPMYDYAHCVSDAVEGITHSFCTLEFEDHRPLYDWFLEKIDLPGDLSLTEPLRTSGLWVQPTKPQQIEFARGNLSYTVMSKRKLAALVRDGLVDGWDDPRMPTLIGVRRRGFTAAAIRTFWDRAGVTKQNSVIDVGVLENCVRDDLDARAPRRMAVLDPLRVTITNLDPAHEEWLEFPNHPKDPAMGTRQVPLSATLLIEQDDFMQVPVKGFRRLQPGGEVRLRGVGIVRCDEVVTDDDGNPIELRCTLDLATRPGQPDSDRKVRGTIHWVSVSHAGQAEVRLYDRLFNSPDPDDDSDGKSYEDHLNPDSRRVVQAYLEHGVTLAEPEQAFQFERLGYFVADRVDHRTDAPVFNRTVSLRDGWTRRGGR